MKDLYTQSYELGYDDGLAHGLARGLTQERDRWMCAVIQLREFREKDSMVCQVLDRLMEIVQVQREG